MHTQLVNVSHLGTRQRYGALDIPCFIHLYKTAIFVMSAGQATHHGALNFSMRTANSTRRRCPMQRSLGHRLAKLFRQFSIVLSVPHITVPPALPCSSNSMPACHPTPVL